MMILDMQYIGRVPSTLVVYLMVWDMVMARTTQTRPRSLSRNKGLIYKTLYRRMVVT